MWRYVKLALCAVLAAGLLFGMSLIGPAPWTESDCDVFVASLAFNTTRAAFPLGPIDTLRSNPSLARCGFRNAEEAASEQRGWIKTFSSQQSAVVSAAGTAQCDWLAAILANGGDPDQGRRVDGAFPLYVAAQRGATVCLRLLIAAGANMKANLSNGETALTVAATLGDLEVAKILAIPDLVNMPLLPPDRVPQNLALPPLMQAATGGVPYLSADIWKNSTRKPEQRDESAYIAVIELLLARGANLYFRNQAGCPATAIAANYGRTEILKALLRLGIDANAACDQGETALVAASMFNHASAVRVLLAAGAKCDLASGIGGHTAVMYAAFTGSAEALTAYAESGKCNLNVVDKKGRTAAHHAAQHDQSETITLLGQFGARMDLMNDDGDTPADVAATHKSRKVIEALSGLHQHPYAEL